VTFADWTLVVWLSPWAVLAVWEVVALVRRWRGAPGSPTISMVAQRYGYRLTSVAYLWCGMATHWWWPAAAWGPAWLAVAFWLVPVGLLAWDVATWPRPTTAWWRSPLLWGAVGAAAGRLLFPQRGLP
jgi:hypothetical protein